MVSSQNSSEFLGSTLAMAQVLYSFGEIDPENMESIWTYWHEEDHTERWRHRLQCISLCQHKDSRSTND